MYDHQRDVEFLEYSLEHQLPNSASAGGLWIMMCLSATGFGHLLRHEDLEWLSLKTYKEQGTWNIRPTRRQDEEDRLPVHALQLSLWGRSRPPACRWLAIAASSGVPVVELNTLT